MRTPELRSHTVPDRAVSSTSAAPAAATAQPLTAASIGTLHRRSTASSRTATDQADQLQGRRERDRGRSGQAVRKVDLSVESSCHGGGDACTATYESFGIKFGDGKPLSTQSFFKLD